MAQPTLWERVKVGGKGGFDKVWKAADKLGAPVNRLSNKLGSEAFWPTTLDKESDKAARILKTFCSEFEPGHPSLRHIADKCSVEDGFYTEEEYQPEEGPKQKQKVVKKIPTSVIQNAKGLAIFTTMRTGLWVSGAGGSGVLIARQEDGSWSPPSGILLHTAGLGFLVGVDIYDCVVVINSEEALEAFTKIRCTLGSEISVAAGPVGAGGVLDSEVHKRQAAIFTYLKSRGFYAGVQIDGTVIIERTDENERFYGQRIPVKEILAGKVRHPPYEVRRLLETIRAAQGDTDVDESILPTEAPPGDYEIEDGHVFGVPDKEDPDPYGVLALEKEGMSIKEAGTQKRASWEAFYFHPAPTSPIRGLYERNSVERRRSGGARKSWRMSGNVSELNSGRSVRNSIDRTPRSPVIMTDIGTQTDDNPASVIRNHSRSSSAPMGERGHMQDVPENDILVTPPAEKTEMESLREVNGYTTPPQTPPLMAKSHELVDEHDDDAQIEEPVVQSVKVFQPVPAQVISKARLVTVPKREPPKLPPRNPNRSGGPMIIDASSKDASTDSVSVESKHDSAHEPSNEKDAKVQPVEKKLEEVKVDDISEDEEGRRPDPWAKVEEAKRSSMEAQDTSTRPDLYDGC